jgi:hypothetical protein
MNRKALLVWVSLLAFSILVFALAASAAPFSPVQKGFVSSGEDVLPYAPDRIIVKFKSDSMRRSKLSIAPQLGASASSVVTGLASVDAISQQVGVTRISRAFIEPANIAEARRIGVERTLMLHVPDGVDIEEAVRRYSADANVEYATPDWRAFPAVVPTDPAYVQHWGHNNTAQLPGLVGRDVRPHAPDHRRDTRLRHQRAIGMERDGGVRRSERHHRDHRLRREFEPPGPDARGGLGLRQRR